jgi:hypothetical protein
MDPLTVRPTSTPTSTPTAVDTEPPTPPPWVCATPRPAQLWCQPVAVQRDWTPTALVGWWLLRELALPLDRVASSTVTERSAAPTVRRTWQAPFAVGLTDVTRNLGVDLPKKHTRTRRGGRKCDRQFLETGFAPPVVLLFTRVPRCTNPLGRRGCRPRRVRLLAATVSGVLRCDVLTETIDTVRRSWSD